MARKCSYCRHTECDKCRVEQKKGKKGYCCQCHRANVMNGRGSSSSASSSRRIQPKKKNRLWSKIKRASK